MRGSVWSEMLPIRLRGIQLAEKKMKAVLGWWGVKSPVRLQYSPSRPAHSEDFFM